MSHESVELGNCRVVLVRPHYAGNLGATARVMHNFGLNQLVLVDPVANPEDEEAKRLATHGEFILHTSRIVASLEQAVADCVLVVATSARRAGYFGLPLPELCDPWPRLSFLPGSAVRFRLSSARNRPG